ncbi:MAG: hypothetical protein QMD99_23010, partial [Rhizobiaceae bacterium]|nr:hypothetical protein [Rhizobiaceae bacterium]
MTTMMSIVLSMIASPSQLLSHIRAFQRLCCRMVPLDRNAGERARHERLSNIARLYRMQRRRGWAMPAGFAGLPLTAIIAMSVPDRFGRTPPLAIPTPMEHEIEFATHDPQWPRRDGG